MGAEPIFLINRRCIFIFINNNGSDSSGPKFVRANEKPIKQNEDLVNNAIRFNEVLLIDETGTQLGVKTRQEALRIAELKNLDLICVAPQAKPPVCKILNYSKYRYNQQKKMKDMRKNQKIVESKEVKINPQTDIGDLKTKAKAVEKWIEDGCKVKLSMRFKGRQLAHIDVGEENINRFLSLLEHVAVIDKKPVLDGKIMSCNIIPKPKQ